VIKLSPMLDDRVLESTGGRLEFVSLGGECREVLVGVAQSAVAPMGRRPLRYGP